MIYRHKSMARSKRRFAMCFQMLYQPTERASEEQEREEAFWCLVCPRNKILIKLAIDREREEIEIPCASSNYSEINLRMGKQDEEKPFLISRFFSWNLLEIEEQTDSNMGGQFLEDLFLDIHKNFSFSVPCTRLCSEHINIREGEEGKIDITKKLHTHTKQLEAPFSGTFAFPWTRFSFISEKKFF